jgi:hypothetical protein
MPEVSYLNFLVIYIRFLSCSVVQRRMEERICTERRGRVANTQDSFSGGLGSKSAPVTEVFPGFPESSHRKAEIVP